MCSECMCACVCARARTPVHAHVKSDRIFAAVTMCGKIIDSKRVTKRSGLGLWARLRHAGVGDETRPLYNSARNSHLSLHVTELLRKWCWPQQVNTGVA